MQTKIAFATLTILGLIQNNGVLTQFSQSNNNGGIPPLSYQAVGYPTNNCPTGQVLNSFSKTCVQGYAPTANIYSKTFDYDDER